MSRISDVSSRLGQYMLAGWILTDDGCTVCSIPMLRSPAGQSPERLICAQCQTSPEAPLSATTAKEAVHRELPPPSTASVSSAGFSRVSTPPTEVSSTLSSPTFAPPPDPQETMRRRAQSDLASAEIGRRMLRGWAMLADECLNDSCYGVPLVRPPKAGGGGKDPRKECVVCGNVYVFEKDSHGLDRLVSLNSTEPSSARRPQEASTSHPENPPVPNVSTAISPPPMFNKHKVNHAQTSFSNTSRPSLHQSTPLQSAIPIIPTLDTSIAALERSLVVLTHRLTALSSREHVDHVTIGDVAMSMEKVTLALRSVKHLWYNEKSVLKS